MYPNLSRPYCIVILPGRNAPYGTIWQAECQKVMYTGPWGPKGKSYNYRQMCLCCNSKPGYVCAEVFDAFIFPRLYSKDICNHFRFVCPGKKVASPNGTHFPIVRGSQLLIKTSNASPNIFREKQALAISNHEIGSVRYAGSYRLSGSSSINNFSTISALKYLPTFQESVSRLLMYATS